MHLKSHDIPGEQFVRTHCLENFEEEEDYFRHLGQIKNTMNTLLPESTAEESKVHSEDAVGAYLDHG